LTKLLPETPEILGIIMEMARAITRIMADID
jgi:hypothetical protein